MLLQRMGSMPFVLEGNVTIEGQELSYRDGFGLWEVEGIDIEASDDARVLLMEVPMEVS